MSIVGSSILHYTILEEIGRGGMGVVYKAHDSTLQRDVALKFVPDDQSSDARARFLREARAASRLNHRNIVSIHAIEQGERDFIVMEYVKGLSLRDALASDTLAPDEAARIASEIASALVTAHNAGVVHRDIKPENILLEDDGTPKVLDFGIAKVEGSAQLTQTDATLGTVAYMSPEQSRGEPVDRRSDIFSLGVILYEMIAGMSPFKGSYPAETTFRIINEDPDPLAKHRPDIADALQAIVTKCLEKKPDDRYQSAADAEADLKALLSDSFSGISTSDANRRTAPGPSSISRVWIASAVAVIALIAVSSFYFMRPAGTSSIAVLPFENGLDDPEAAFLCDGIPESLINRLTYVPGFKVTSRAASFSFRDKATDPAGIGEALNVQTVLLGRLERRGDNLSITAELVDTRDNTQIWGEKFSRPISDVMDIEEEIATSIANRLQLKLSAETEKQLSTAESTSPDAYQLYLKGRYMIIGSSYEMDRAIEYFQQATEIDPDFVLAWAGIAEGLTIQAYLTLGTRKELLGKARDALNRAMSIDPDSPNTLVAKGLIDFYFDWNWEEAHATLSRAIEINPGFAPAHTRLTDVLIAMDRLEDAKASALRAVELDPLSVGPTHDLGIVHYLMGEYDAASHEFDKAVELHPDWTWGYVKGGMANAYGGNAERAHALLEEADEKVEGWGSALIQSWIALAYARSGRVDLAQVALDKMLARQESEHVDGIPLGYAYLAVGDKENALKSLKRAVDERSADAVWMKVSRNTLFEAIGSDPRYDVLVERMGFPE
jgi:serine/threonine protein kinase/tetratricopeptide (TPR) repeat protein